MNRNTLIFLGIAVVLVVGGVLAVLILQFDAEKQILPTQENGEVQGASPISALLVGPNAVYAASQPSANKVIISQVVLESSGFVVIREDANGGPSRIIGWSALLNAGESVNIEVELPRQTKEGEIFYAVLYQDNGNGTFDSTEDLPLKDEQENNVLMKFEVNSTAKLPEEVLM